MRVTVSHSRPTEEVKQAIDRSFDDVLKGMMGMPVQLIQEHKSWSGSNLAFTLVAKLGLLSTPIKGTIEVTEHDVTIDVDFGLLERLIPTNKVRDAFGDRVKGLLK